MADAHELWSAAQLAPGEGIEDGVARIEALLDLPAPAGEPEMPEVNDLAQEIRRVDGNHSLGAGALAEALMPFLEAHRALPASAGEPEMPEVAAYLRADAAKVMTADEKSAWAQSGQDWQEIHREYTTPLVLLSAARAWGDARAEHARRVARERCAGVLRYWLGGEDGGSYEGRCLAHINSGKADPRERAAAPPQGEQTCSTKRD